jgi:hypothetical protein
MMASISSSSHAAERRFCGKLILSLLFLSRFVAAWLIVAKLAAACSLRHQRAIRSKNASRFAAFPFAAPFAARVYWVITTAFRPGQLWRFVVFNDYASEGLLVG